MTENVGNKSLEGQRLEKESQHPQSASLWVDPFISILWLGFRYVSRFYQASSSLKFRSSFRIRLEKTVRGENAL
jgi:hypothetical protein